jgi:hypothetical protein
MIGDGTELPGNEEKQQYLTVITYAHSGCRL